MSLANGQVGSLKTLYQMLGAFLSVYGIDVRFGEEFIFAQDVQVPVAVIVPVGGPWEQNGYGRDTAHTTAGGHTYNLSDDENNRWMTHEDIDIVCWGADVDANGHLKDNATPVDHADATENLVNMVLRALQDQAPNGLMYRPVRGQWIRAKDEVLRYGRAYALTVNVDKTVTGLQPVDATIIEVEINPSITEG